MSKSPEELARELGVPLIAPMPKATPPYETNPVVAVCGECGRKVCKVEGYCCGNGNCPIQPRAWA